MGLSIVNDDDSIVLDVEGSGCDQERDLGLTVYADKVNPKDLSEGGIYRRRGNPTSACLML